MGLYGRLCKTYYDRNRSRCWHYADLFLKCFTPAHYFRVPNFKLISKRYLILGAILFIAYELCFSFALAYSKTAQQAIEVSIVNYLWPSLTVLAFVIFRELKFNVFIILGLLISISGIIFIQTGNGDFSLGRVVDNFHSNPLSYVLAFIGAIIWAFTVC